MTPKVKHKVDTYTVVSSINNPGFSIKKLTDALGSSWV